MHAKLKINTALLKSPFSIFWNRSMGNTDSNCNFQLKIFAQSFFSPIFLKITFKRCALLESKQVDLFALLCVWVTTLSALLYVIKKKKKKGYCFSRPKGYQSGRQNYKQNPIWTNSKRKEIVNIFPETGQEAKNYFQHPCLHWNPNRHHTPSLE